MHPMIRKVIYMMTCKRINEKGFVFKKIDLQDDDVNYFGLSSNLITSFEYENEIHYFRECLEILPSSQYFKKSIDKFFFSLDKLGINEEHFKQIIPIKLNFSKEIVSRFKVYIDGKCHNRNYNKTIKNIDVISERIHFSIWEKQVYNLDFFREFSFHDLPEDLYDIAIYFLWHMRSAASNYRTLKIARSKKYSYFGAVRNIASRIIAEELNLSHMIPKTQLCILTIGKGEAVIGVLSDAAPGNRMMDSSVELNGSLQKELMNLNVLDVISNQIDHGPNNYNIHLDKDNYRICAFDNDNPYTFFPVQIYKSIADCKPLIDKKGYITRPFFDKNLAFKLNNLDLGKLVNRLKPYLNMLQIAAVLIRIRKIKKSIERTMYSNVHFLLDNESWSKATAEQEVCGVYGNTYLLKAVELVYQKGKENTKLAIMATDNR